MKGKIQMKKIIFLLCMSLICVSCFAGCGNNSAKENIENDTTTSEDVITSEDEAISAAKNFKYTGDHIANELKFKTYYPPDYGICEAVDDGDYWTVILKGNMSGCRDEYNDKKENSKFYVKAIVYKNGNVTVGVN